MTADLVRARAADVLLCLSFYTRLPLPGSAANVDFASAQWAAPIAGAAIALIGAAVYAAGFLLSLPVLAAAALAVASTMLASGALHEDGLGDTADGFGGGRTRERKLEIMRDSRIGTFGAAALSLSILLRCSALAGIASPIAALAALVAAHMASRALMPAFMHRIASARTDGLAAALGAPSLPVSITALTFGAASLLLIGPTGALVAIAGLAGLFLLLARLSLHHIGGMTGDVLGALQQAAEIMVLLVAAAIASHL